MRYEERLAEATAYHAKSLLNVNNNPEPVNQKYHVGERVWISRELPKWMCHFTKGKWATVVYTYAHAYGGDDVENYCLDIDGEGESSWYDEYLLSRDGSDAVIPEDAKHYPDKCSWCKFKKDLRSGIDKILLEASLHNYKDGDKCATPKD